MSLPVSTTPQRAGATVAGQALVEGRVVGGPPCRSRRLRCSRRFLAWPPVLEGRPAALDLSGFILDGSFRRFYFVPADNGRPGRRWLVRGGCLAGLIGPDGAGRPAGPGTAPLSGTRHVASQLVGPLTSASRRMKESSHSQTGASPSARSPATGDRSPGRTPTRSRWCPRTSQLLVSSDGGSRSPSLGCLLDFHLQHAGVCQAAVHVDVSCTRCWAGYSVVRLTVCVELPHTDRILRL